MRCAMFIKILAVAVIFIFGQISASNENKKTGKTGFVWTDCKKDSDSAAVRFNSVNISPNLIKMPGDVFVTVDATVSRTLRNLTVQNSMHKNVWGYSIKVPCIKGMGSCKIDLCQKYAAFCELKPGPFKLNTRQSLPSLGLMKPLAAGVIKTTTKFYENADEAKEPLLVGCLYTEMTLQ